ncbi:MAG TPA: hypothetical protein VFX58_13485 [Chitinophagaceae bacterium]|nr:hypothetical protein [Chitinophagaceae bacterium]
MEVHHHAHTPRKKWGHYFWEFFMLFLAVTLGFFVENQREHYIEHKRGIQYVKSFVEDLKTDTARFSYCIQQYEKKERILGDLFICYDSIRGGLPGTTCLKNIYAATIGFQDLIYTDRTLQQLKNSGGLRLIEEEDADSIIVYDQLLRYLLKVETSSLQETQTRVRESRNSVFAYSARTESEWEKGVEPENVALFSADPALLNRFFNEVMVYRFACRFQLRQTIKLKQKAIGLIRFYTEKHHFK